MRPFLIQLCFALLAVAMGVIVLTPSSFGFERPAVGSERFSCRILEPVFDNAGRRALDRTLPDDSVPLYAADADTLRQYIASGPKGRTIIVAPGRYNIGTVSITDPLTLHSETLGGAVFTRGTLLKIKAENVRIDGFTFTDGTSVADKNSRDHAIMVQANAAIIQNNLFHQIGRFSTISDGTGIGIAVRKSDDVQIENNTFHDFYGIAIHTDDRSRNVRIRHNDFLDSQTDQAVGEIAHIGDATSLGQARSPSDDRLYADISYNYARNWSLESELVSIKSDRNHVAYNLIDNPGTGAFVIRMGNENIIERNIMRGFTAMPLRLSGEANTVRQNYFSGRGDMMFLHNLVDYPPSEKNLKAAKNLKNAYWAANRNVITANAFVGISRILATIDQDYVIRDAPVGNVVRYNRIASPKTKALKNQMRSSDLINFSRNRLRGMSRAPCPDFATIKKAPFIEPAAVFQP